MRGGRDGGSEGVSEGREGSEGVSEGREEE